MPYALDRELGRAGRHTSRSTQSISRASLAPRSRAAIAGLWRAWAMNVETMH